MLTIQAWQHLYANVEKEQSPQGRGGFQTLFYSHSGLNEAEVEELEGRLLYFPSTGSEPVKRLFFITESGKGVVAQIAPLPDPDRLGRKGRYLAHSLVFEPEALTSFEADPFRVFRCYPFITTVAEALAQGDFQTGDLPATALALPADPAYEIKAARFWPAPELKKLALLALRAGQLARQRQVVTLAGEPAQLETVLEAAFLAVPAASRPHCTFDTYFYRCNLVAAYFWAIGLPEPPASFKFVLAVAAARQVQGPVSLEPESAYERWLVAAIEGQRLAEIVRSRDSAFAVGEWLDDRRYDLAQLEAASSELIIEVFKLNPGPVQAGLQRRASQHLPPALVGRVAGFVYEQSDETALYRRLRQGFDLPELLELLHQSYAIQEFRKPPSAEVEALQHLLKRVDHAEMRLFLAYWSDPRRQLPRELARVSEVEYRHFSQIALQLKLIEPLALLAPGRGEVFLDLYLARGVEDMLELVDALLGVKEINCLSRLAAYVPDLSAGDLTGLERRIARQPDTPALFQEAIRQAIAAQPARQGILGRLRALWPGKGAAK